MSKVIKTAIPKLTSPRKAPFTVFIEGNIGAGKTTFLNHFKKYDDVRLYTEPVEKWRNVDGFNLLVIESIFVPHFSDLIILNNLIFLAPNYDARPQICRDNIDYKKEFTFSHSMSHNISILTARHMFIIRIVDNSVCFISISYLQELMYKESHKWAFPFQTYVTLTMLQTHTELTNKRIKLMERSLYSARLAFSFYRLIIVDSAFIGNLFQQNQNGHLFIYFLFQK